MDIARDDEEGSAYWELVQGLKKLKEPPPTKQASLTKRSNPPDKPIQEESFSGSGESSLTSLSDSGDSPGSTQVKASSVVDGEDRQSSQNDFPLPLSHRASLSDFGM